MTTDGRLVRQFFPLKGLKNRGKDSFYQMCIRDRTYTFEYDVKDEVIVGNSQPKLEGVLGSTLYYKGFSFSFFFRYKLGADVFNNAMYTKVEKLCIRDRNKNVMAYMKALSVGTTGEMDSIFRKWVHQPILVEAYDNLCRANRKLEKGQPAVSFTFPDINGKEVSLSDFKGKYVYVDLWATLCGPVS